jgi:hypothetical protein
MPILTCSPGKLTHKRALLAMVFASATLNSLLPALCENIETSPEAVIQEVASDSRVKSYFRSWLLLRLANYLLNGSDIAETAKQFKPVEGAVDWPWKSFEPIFFYWTESLLGGVSMPSCDRKIVLASDSQKSKAAANALANTAIDAAMTMNADTTNVYAKLHLFLTARCLYQKLENTSGVQRCDSSLDGAISACELSKSNDPELVRAATSVLNLMAYSIIPLQISVIQSQQEKFNRPYTDSDFEACEKLKLRAVAIADRLDPTDDTRRKVHRDLALWYTQLGKLEKGQREKDVLFQLVGIKDESILYPVSRGCGSLVWWEPSVSTVQSLCGMG